MDGMASPPARAKNAAPMQLSSSRICTKRGIRGVPVKLKERQRQDCSSSARLLWRGLGTADIG
ncbi:predicted protein [Plenodomus lingam JN3]|uniref:Predicted protein n=1 Tax=Leptosphaeria maculans (strain JN3 / isolate v23.1.3 / race Av1-4-5-6-7-8) TaxID=985895 RepID=E4ZY86_LEPMJ|nr:predicted protein [Plenodomus lingam JN3]CBX96331.1 predicted protein [Plenodomus lingam JN3]